MRNISLFQKHILFVSKNAHGIEYIPFNMTILYKCILDCLQSRNTVKQLWMIFIHPLKSSQHSQIRRFAKALLRNGLKISPRSVNLFRINLQYFGNEIFIKDKRVCIKPLKIRLEAIHKLQPLTTIKGCRSFVGMVNFFTMFCPELKKLLKPMYNLRRKGR